MDKWKDRGVSLWLYEKSSGIVVLSEIVVADRKQGTGTEVMNDITNYADGEGKTVALTPSTDYGATSVTRLKGFYKRFGFVENKGRKKDYSISETMYRRPRMSDM